MNQFNTYRSHDILEESFIPDTGLSLPGNLSHGPHTHNRVVSEQIHTTFK